MRDTGGATNGNENEKRNRGRGPGVQPSLPLCIVKQCGLVVSNFIFFKF